MNDDASDDLPIIDVRSPAERAADSGRAGFERVQQRLRDNHLDIAALLWMVFVIGLLAVEVWSAFNSSRFDVLGGESKGWVRAAFVTGTGGITVSFGCMIGIALAVWVDSGPARAALVLAVVGGAWAIIANLVGVAVVFHRDDGGISFLTNLGDNRAVALSGQLMLAGFGVVAVLVGLMLLTSRGKRAEADSEVTAAG